MVCGLVGGFGACLFPITVSGLLVVQWLMRICLWVMVCYFLGVVECWYWLLVDLLFVWVALGFGFECVVCEWFTGVW